MRDVETSLEPVCGIDEAGRGPLAGPVVAAAVILPKGFPIDILDDSKKLSEKKRENAAALILESAALRAIAWVWPAEIDRLNIHRAALEAMRRAFAGLGIEAWPDRDGRELDTVVDGAYIPDLPVPCRAIVKGDGLVPAIMAASILAKVARDRWMRRYSWIDPRYEFEIHKGYPTKRHYELIRVHGPCGIHRASFRLWPDG